MTEDSATSRVSRKRSARRERIVEAAFAAIAESGPADFSLNQLARDLDYTPGALYWYFPSKEALVVEVQRIAFTELAEKIRGARGEWEARVINAGLSLEGQRLYSLLSLANYYLDLGRDQPQYARLIAFSLDPRVWLDDQSVQVLVPVLGAVFTEVATPFFDAQSAGVISSANPAVRAVQFWAALQGALQVGKLSRINPELFDGPKLGMDTARTMLLGWGADPDALSAAQARVDAKT